eukprot:gene32405-41986_t
MADEERVVFSSVTFKSIPREKFRVHLKEDEKEILKINIESRNSKTQWQSSAGSEETSTINGIPKGGVFHALRDAFRTADRSNVEDLITVKSEAGAVIDFKNYGAEDAYLALSISVFGSPVGFEFKLKEIELKDVDILRAQLVDAQEELLLLKRTLETLQETVEKTSELKVRIASLENAQGGKYVSLRSTDIATAIASALSWPTVVSNDFPAFLSVAADFRSISVNQPGVYQVHVRLGITNRNNGQAIYLQVNGSIVAQSLHADASGYQTTVQITETMVLQAKDSLQVTSSGRFTIVTALSSVFTVLRLA